MDEPRVLLHGAQARNGHTADLTDAAEVVADQVDDHDVLGVVLLQEVALGAAGAFDGPGMDDLAFPAKEQLRRG